MSKKDVKIFGQNAKKMQKALKRNGHSNQKDMLHILNNELTGIGVMAEDKDSSFQDIAAHVVDTMTLAQAIGDILKASGKKPKKKLIKALNHAAAAGKALAVTTSIGRSINPLRKIDECEIKI